MEPVLRVSMWSLVQRANWLATAQCPKCGEINHVSRQSPFRKPMIELNDAGLAWCGVCSTEWVPNWPRPAVVT